MLNLARKSYSYRTKFSHMSAVFVDAPIILKPADLPQNLASIGAAEVSAEVQSEDISAELIPRGWWLRDKPSTLDDFVTHISDLIQKQNAPLDVRTGVIFSLINMLICAGCFRF